DHVGAAAWCVDTAGAGEGAGRHVRVVVIEPLVGAAGNRRDARHLPVVENRLGQDVVELVAEIRYLVRVVYGQHVRTSSGIRVAALVVIALLDITLVEGVDGRQVLAENLVG